jgi:ankyrin repeat protein
MTVLHMAAKSGHTAAVRLLLEKSKLDVNAKVLKHETVLLVPVEGTSIAVMCLRVMRCFLSWLTILMVVCFLLVSIYLFVC